MKEKKIGQFIKHRRKELGLSQGDMAKFLCVAVPTVSKWENDERTPDLPMFSSIAQLLKIDLESLINCSSTLNNDYDIDNKFNIDDFSSYFSYLRKKKGYTLSSLAKKLQVSYQTISKWENKESVPNIYTLIKCSVIFKVSLSELYYGKELLKKEKDEKIKNKLLIISSCFILVVAIIASMVVLLYDDSIEDSANNFNITLNDKNKAIIEKYEGNDKEIVIPSVVEYGNNLVEVEELSFNLLKDYKNVEKLTIPFVGKSKYDETYNYLGYLFGAESCEFNELVIPKTLKEVTITNADCIAKYAFNNCRYIETITLSNNLKRIQSDAFLGCDNLDYEIENNLKYLKCDNNNHFALIGVTDQEATQYLINKNTVLIAGDAFFKCKNFEDIEIPKTVKYSSARAFAGTNGLKNVYYEGTMVDWCNIIFENYQSNPMYNTAKKFYLKNQNGEYVETNEITIPESITTIGQYQFDGFENITNVFLHNNLISIGKNAFSYCKSLKSIFIPISVIKMGSGVFNSCPEIQIYCESTSKPIGWDEAWCSGQENKVYWGSTSK